MGPAITLVPQLFSLPFFIVSFTLGCRNLETSGIRYLLIASYLASLTPQLTSFLLYVSPSSFYSNEWRSTGISQWMSYFMQRRSEVSTTATLVRTAITKEKNQRSEIEMKETCESRPI